MDVLERLTVLFSSNGNLVNAEIDGCIQLKSFLWGNPSLSLALNSDLVINSSGQINNDVVDYGHGVVLDDCNFHECVNLKTFDESRTLEFNPPDGEFVLMNYRISGDVGSMRVPFRVFPVLEELDSHHLELKLSVRADIPSEISAANFTVAFSVPQATGSVSNYLGANVQSGGGTAAAARRGGKGGGKGGGRDANVQTTEYQDKKKLVTWNIKRFKGGTEQYLRTKINLVSPATHNTRREVGPFRLNFEIPMYNISSVRVRYLKISNTGGGGRNKPARWVRTVTQAASYIVRI